MTPSPLTYSGGTEAIFNEDGVRLNMKKDKVWRKDPDISLAESIERSQRWSILREGGCANLKLTSKEG